MKKITTKKIIVLSNPETGKSVWHYGAAMMDTLNAAKRAMGRKRICPAVERAAVEISRCTLKQAIACGYTNLVEVEEVGTRNRVECKINLPARWWDAVKFIEGLEEI